MKWSRNAGTLQDQRLLQTREAFGTRQASDGPAVSRVTVEFSEQGAGTRVVLMHKGLPNGFICRTVSQRTHV